MKKIKIALDGPAGAGKSTVAKEVAMELGIVYIDTGAMYRTAALFAIRNKIDIKNEKEKLLKEFDKFDMDIVYTDKGQRMYLAGEDISEKIRTEEVSMKASDIAVIPEIRLKLVEIQRSMAENGSVIMDGRDIGSYVLPDAELKIFLTASPECRAKRRYDENLQKGIEADFDNILADIKRRDKNDSEREFAPLRCREDAVLIDSTLMTKEAVVEKIKKLALEIIG